MNNIYRNLLLVSLLFALSFNTKAQLAYSPYADSLASLATNDEILLLTRQLAGDTSVTVNGQVVTINSRHYLSSGNQTASQFIYEKFEEYGYTPEFQYFSNGRGVNVIATKQGTLYPDQVYIICGHYDNMPSGPVAPGADDNASGTVATMLAAKVLSNIDLAYTVKFIAWDEEEIGLVGSEYYAEQAAAMNEDIKGVLNLDMIAWDSNDDFVYSIATNATSMAFTNDFILTTDYYQPQLTHNYINTTASDHASFWDQGYPAFLAIEDWYDFHQYYHTVNDDIQFLNMPYFGALARAAIANIASNGLNQRFFFHHDPVSSGISTESREAKLIVTGDHPVDYTNFQPRLYYSTNGLSFNFLLPSEISGDTIWFQIPGFPIGTTIHYYFAVQDADARMMATYPAGGRGISPPGTISPNTSFQYEVDYVFYNEYCSSSTPVNIPDNSSTINEVTITQEGELHDMDVMVDITHPRLTELRLILINPEGNAILLSNNNGGDGDNYTHTIFDDEAEVSIVEGFPPYTGRFKPEASLSSLDNEPIAGLWKLRINESGLPGSNGVLNHWCMHIFYRDTTVIGLEESKIITTALHQNYPNPVRSSTTIKLQLAKSEKISLKLFDNNGRLIRIIAEGIFSAGDHLLVTSLGDLEPGSYSYTLTSTSVTETRRLIVIK